MRLISPRESLSPRGRSTSIGTVGVKGCIAPAINLVWMHEKCHPSPREASPRLQAARRYGAVGGNELH